MKIYCILWFTRTVIILWQCGHLSCTSRKISRFRFISNARLLQTGHFTVNFSLGLGLVWFIFYLPFLSCDKLPKKLHSFFSFFLKTVDNLVISVYNKIITSSTSYLYYHKEWSLSIYKMIFVKFYGSWRNGKESRHMKSFSDKVRDTRKLLNLNQA